MGLWSSLLERKPHYCLAHSLDLVAKVALLVTDVKEILQLLNVYIFGGNSGAIAARLSSAIPELKVSDLNYVMTRWNLFLIAMKTCKIHFHQIRDWVKSELRPDSSKSLILLSTLFTDQTEILMNTCCNIFGPISDIITLSECDSPTEELFSKLDNFQTFLGVTAFEEIQRTVISFIK